MKRGKTIFIILCVVSMLAFFSCSSEPKGVQEEKGPFKVVEKGKRFETLQKTIDYIETLCKPSTKDVNDNQFTIEVLQDTTDTGGAFSGDVDVNVSLKCSTNVTLTIESGAEEATGIVIPSSVSMTFEEVNIVSKNDDAPIITSNGTVEIKDSVIETESSIQPAISCGDKTHVTITDVSIKTSATDAPAIEVTSGSVNVTGKTTINDGDSSKQAISIAPTTADDSVKVSFDENFNGTVSGTIKIESDHADKDNLSLSIGGGTFDVNGLDKVSENVELTLSGEKTQLVIPEIEAETVAQNSVQETHIHLYSWRNDEKHHWKQCSTCGSKDTEEEHNQDNEVVIKEATCTEEGERHYKCSVCDFLMKKESIQKRGHSTVETVYSPTCVVKGYTEIKCTNCPYTVRTSETSLTDHQFIVLTETDSTCGELGSRVKQCKVCGLIETEVIGLKEKHNFVGEYTREGAIEYRKCTVCGKKEIRDHVHKLEEEGTLKTSATCLSPAVYTYSCSCGEYSEDHSVGNPEPHKYVWVTTDSDVHYEICTICGHEQNRTAHVLEETERKTAKCEEDGYIKYVCSCGYKTQTDLPKIGCHSLYVTSRTDASCADETKGEIEYSCSNPNCDYSCKTETDWKHVYEYVYDKDSKIYIWKCAKCGKQVNEISVDTSELSRFSLDLEFDKNFSEGVLKEGDTGTVSADLKSLQSEEDITYKWTWDNCDEEPVSGNTLKIGPDGDVRLCIGKHSINVVASIVQKKVNYFASAVITIK